MSTAMWRRSRPSAPSQFADWLLHVFFFLTRDHNQPPTVVPGGDLANVMRAVCVISNSPASPFGARSPRGERDTPPVQWQTVCRWYVGLQSMCETVSAASAVAVACRWFFRDVRKLSRPFDTASSSESESQRPTRRNFNGEPVHAASLGRDTNPGHVCQRMWLAANCYRPHHVQAHWTILGAENCLLGRSDHMANQCQKGNIVSQLQSPSHSPLFDPLGCCSTVGFEASRTACCRGSRDSFTFVHVVEATLQPAVAAQANSGQLIYSRAYLVHSTDAMRRWRKGSSRPEKARLSPGTQVAFACGQTLLV